MGRFPAKKAPARKILGKNEKRVAQWKILLYNLFVKLRVYTRLLEE